MDNEKKQPPKAEKKKQIPLRLSETLYNDLAAWADDDFRSINGQIEYLLSQAVKKQRKTR
ncbi:MAG: Arc family DNA-binding protein [Defluviitaleaceae bacterium]|nr:Arc family DNA-binding protein [Defluviitaleaceae bacterium]